LSPPSAPLSIVLEPSRRLRGFLIALHGLATLAALVNGLPLWGKIAALTLVACSARHHLRNVAHLPIVSLHADAEQNWRLGLASGREMEARLLPGTVVSRWLIVLHLRDATGRFHALPVLPDSVDSESYRRLCVCLRGSNPPERPRPNSVK